MNKKQEIIAEHYGIYGLEEKVKSAMQEIHGNLENLSLDDLAPIDSFHIRGHQATHELAQIVGIDPGWNVLDVGSGLGGTARLLASEYKCQVTGIDLTPEYVSLAAYFSEILRMTSSTRFECGSALSMPFSDSFFDCVWMEHVQMNIDEKEGLIKEIYRVLKPKGRLGMHEVFRGEGGEPYLPLGWAEDSKTSFMVTEKEMRQEIENHGFSIEEWKDVTEVTKKWVKAQAEKAPSTEQPPIGLQILLGSKIQDKMVNLGKSLFEDRLVFLMAVIEKPK